MLNELILSDIILRIYPKNISQENHVERLRDVSFNNSNEKSHVTDFIDNRLLRQCKIFFLVILGIKKKRFAIILHAYLQYF